MKLSTALYSLLAIHATTTAHAVGVRGSNNDNHEPRALRPLDDTCTAVLKVTDFAGNASPGGDTELECELPNGKFFTVPVTKDWIEEKRSNGFLISGKTKLDTRGATFDEATGELILPNGSPPGLVNNPNHNRKLAVTQGTKSVLVVRVVAADGAATTDEAGLSDNVFGTYGDPVNLKSQYQACSKGDLDFVPALSRTKVGGGVDASDISVGATTVNVATTVAEGDVTMRNAVTQALNAQFGVSSPTALANHVMYCLPAQAMNGIAYAFVNSWMSVYKDTWCNSPSGQIHEIGHNLNLAHANEGGTTYEDQSSMMGYSYSNDDGPKMCFNGANFWQLGWFPNSERLLVEEASFATGTSISIDLDGIAIADNTNPKVVRFSTGNANSDLYMVFNWKSLHNSGAVEAGNQVTIVEKAGEGYSESWLVAKLNAGASFSRPSFFSQSGRALTVTVNTIDTTTGRAVVTAEIEQQCSTNADCADGNLCNGVETCQSGVCVAGTNVDCSGQFSICGAEMVCRSSDGACVDNGTGEDGTCSLGETCATCPTDCTFELTSGGTTCGNGVCEVGEDCTNCPVDCAGQTTGKPDFRFCCAGDANGVEFGVSCTDSRCTASGCDTSPSPITSGTTCCGDDICNADGENADNCPTDCDGLPQTSPPTVAPSTATPLTAAPSTATPLCPVCGATGEACCGTCIDNGKPSGRGCF